MDFLTLLNSRNVLLIDGGMGTELGKRGLEQSPTNNLTNPDAVYDVHREYAEAGADILLTNTLVMNRLYVETHELNVDLKAVNQAGVRLAKKAAGHERLVFGDMSSTGQLLEPYGNYTESQFYDNFKEQAEILAESGVDGFMIETMIDLNEAVCALKACKFVSSLPVVVSLSFATTAKGGRTIMGNSALDLVKAVSDFGGDVIGLNCGDLTPVELVDIVDMIHQATHLPIAVQPNAGKPVLVDDQTRFEMTPQVFGEGVVQCIQAGARLVGGCCGTTPAHIRELARLINSITTG